MDTPAHRLRDGGEARIKNKNVIHCKRICNGVKTADGDDHGDAMQIDESDDDDSVHVQVGDVQSHPQSRIWNRDVSAYINVRNRWYYLLPFFPFSPLNPSLDVTCERPCY